MSVMRKNNKDALICPICNKIYEKPHIKKFKMHLELEHGYDSEDIQDTL